MDVYHSPAANGDEMGGDSAFCLHRAQLDKKMLPQFALPGHILDRKPTEGLILGTGVYLDKDGELRASKMGAVNKESQEDGSIVISVESVSSDPSCNVMEMSDRVIIIGDICYCRVTKIMQNQAITEIICVNNHQLRVHAKGVVLREDVKATETDQLNMAECFRPGDIIRAIVTNLSDRNQYCLSTVEEEYGVRYAKSRHSGNLMIAVDYTSMKDPVSGNVEKRKVARN